MSAAGDVSLTAQTPRARRRKLTGQIMEGLATAAALLAVAVLAIVLISVAKKGLPALNLDFFTKNAAPFGESGGGIANAIVGTVIIVLIAAGDCAADRRAACDLQHRVRAASGWPKRSGSH